MIDAVNVSCKHGKVLDLYAKTQSNMHMAGGVSAQE